jgi:hypothetical protein
MSKEASFEQYRLLVNSNFPTLLGICDKNLYSQVANDESTVWALNEHGLRVPYVINTRYMPEFNRQYFDQVHDDTIGVCLDTKLSMVVDEQHLKKNYGAVLEVCSIPGDNEPEPPAYRHAEIDPLLQDVDGLASTVHYVAATIPPATTDEANHTNSDPTLDAEVFEEMWRELYIEPFTKLSAEFPVSGFHTVAELRELFDARSANRAYIMKQEKVSAMIMTLAPTEYAQCNTDFLSREFPDTELYYCPVAVADGDATNAIRMMKKLGKILMSQGGGVLLYDCPNRSYYYDLRLVSAMKLKVGINQRLYARQVFRLVLV